MMPLEATYCRYASADVIDALGDACLGPREQVELAAWRDAGRRRAWLRGRVLAKQLIAACQATSAAPPVIEILSRDAAGRVNRPRVSVDGVARPWSLSISHTDRGVLAAVCLRPAHVLGVDLAPAADLHDGLLRVWFTPAERRWVERTCSSAIACFIWSAKEALYKACNRGESFDPRAVEIRSHGEASYRRRPISDIRLRSWTVDGHVAVMASVAAA